MSRNDRDHVFGLAVDSIRKSPGGLRCLSGLSSSKRCPSRDVSGDDRKGDPPDRTRTLRCVGNRLSTMHYAQLCTDCRRRSPSCGPPKLVPLFNESGKLVPTSHRWGHHHCPASAGSFLCKRSPRIEGRSYRSPRPTGCVTILLSAQPGSDLLRTRCEKRHPQSPLEKLGTK